MTIPPCADYCTVWNPTRSYPTPLKDLIPYCLTCVNYPKPKPQPKEKPK